MRGSVESRDQNDEKRQGNIRVAFKRLAFNAEITTDSFSEYDHAESSEAIRAMRNVQMESRIGGQDHESERARQLAIGDNQVARSLSSDQNVDEYDRLK